MKIFLFVMAGVFLSLLVWLGLRDWSRETELAELNARLVQLAHAKPSVIHSGQDVPVSQETINALTEASRQDRAQLEQMRAELALLKEHAAQFLDTRALGFSGVQSFESSYLPGGSTSTTDAGNNPEAPRWSSQQAAGAPDTKRLGDVSTAWAPKEQDAGEQWLQAEYETPVDLAEINVHESNNPGAITKVVAMLENGQEVEIWQGSFPSEEDHSNATEPVERAFQSTANLRAKSVRVFLDTSKTPGWEEIDAIEMVGRDGSRQWAKSISASSSYSDAYVTETEIEQLSLER